MEIKFGNFTEFIFSELFRFDSHNLSLRIYFFASFSNIRTFSFSSLLKLRPNLQPQSKLLLTTIKTQYIIKHFCYIYFFNFFLFVSDGPAKLDEEPKSSIQKTLEVSSLLFFFFLLLPWPVRGNFIL